STEGTASPTTAPATTGTGHHADGGSSSGAASSTTMSGHDASTTAGEEVSICWRPCTEPADCCLEGSGPGCPDSYPTNYACEHGLCRLIGCTGDADCQPSAEFAHLTCHVYDGYSICMKLCGSSEECPE